MRYRSTILSAVLTASCVLALAAATGAGAATRPSVSTGSAHNVSYSTATLAGTVNPNGADTSYYFQYGKTRVSFENQSIIADAGAGTHTVKVNTSITGLQPLTLYHYRLVAVNSAGISIGSAKTFTTTKVPLSLQILASPNPVLFGGTVVVQGTLSGTNNANRTVILQANSFPFTAGFQNLGNPELTTATGGFSFPVLGLSVATQFRVVTTTNPVIVSATAGVNVAVKVSSHVRKTRRRHFARIYGTVTPAEDGAHVGILKIVHGRGVLVGGTILRHRDAASSKFSRVVHVSRGAYRVLVLVTTGAQISNYGQPLLIG
jgi:hypothetical protein